jgi:hypothetical protein
MRRCLLSMIAVGTMMTATAAHAVQMSCPATQKGKRLTAVSLFDGSPEEKAELRPEEGRERNGLLRTYWMLEDIHKAGRAPHVVCDYDGGAQVVMKPGKTVKACIRFLQRDRTGEYRVFSVRCE